MATDSEIYDLPLPDGTEVEIAGDDFEVEVEDLGSVTAHANKGASRLIERFQKPVYRAIVRAAGEELQEVENMLWGVLLSRYIDNAAGEALKFIGLRVGEPPANLSDPDYRVRIRARVLINRSRGGPEDILGIIRALEGVGHIRNTGRASMRVDLESEPENPATRAQLPSLLGEAVSGGVSLHAVVPTSRSFRLGSVAGGVDAPSVLGSVAGGVDEPGLLADGRMV